MRKTPVQQRSKMRVEAILNATEAAIIANGISSITMEGIAENANVSIGSLYQYFESRDEVFRQLCRRYYKELDILLEPYFTRIRSIADFIRDIQYTLRICWDYTLTKPGFRALFFDVQAWEVMREVDWEDTRSNAARMADALHPLMPLVPYEDLLALGMIIGDGAASIARIAARFDDMKEPLFNQFIELITNRIFTLMCVNVDAERRLLNTAPDVEMAMFPASAMALTGTRTPE